MSLNWIMDEGYEKPWLDARVENLNIDNNLVIQHKTRQAFTPDILGSTTNPTSVTYASRSGRWSQIGSMCTYNCFLDVTAINGGSGALLVTLPKVAFTGLYQVGTVMLSGSPAFTGLDTDKGYQISSIIDNVAGDNDVVKIFFTGSDSGAPGSGTGFYQLSNNAIQIYIGITYLTNSD